MTRAEMERRAVILGGDRDSRLAFERERWDALSEMLEQSEHAGMMQWRRRMRNVRMEGGPVMADGLFYRDSKPPWLNAAETSITLATTDKLLYPGGRTALAAAYFAFIGKAVQLTVFGTVTTAATPGNIGVEMYYGTTDAGGTLLGSSAALALVASQTTIPFRIEAYARARATGAGVTGSIFAWAITKIGIAVIASPNDHFLVPASAPAAVAVDTTVASGFNLQMKRSGSTAEAAVTQDIIFEALN